MDLKDKLSIVATVTAAIAVVPPIVSMFKSSNSPPQTIITGSDATIHTGSGSIYQNKFVTYIKNTSFVESWKNGFEVIIGGTTVSTVPNPTLDGRSGIPDNPPNLSEKTSDSSTTPRSEAIPLSSDSQHKPEEVRKHESKTMIVQSDRPREVDEAGMSLSHPEGSPVVEAWINVLMKTKDPDGAVPLIKVMSGTFCLRNKISWRSDEIHKEMQSVEVPQGFVALFSSVPRIFWEVLPPEPAYIYPAIIHDYLYWTQTTTREKADEIFRKMMEEISIAPIKVNAIYHAVRAAGGPIWGRNAGLKKSGEKRMLEVSPDGIGGSLDQRRQRCIIFDNE